MSFCWLSLVTFEEFIFEKLVTNQLIGWQVCVAEQGTFYHQQDFEQVGFHSKLRLYNVGWSVRDGKVTICLQLTQNWKAWTKVRQKLLFLSTLAATLRCHAEKIDNLHFVQGEKFEFIESLRNNEKNNLLIFDNSCEQIGNSEAYVVSASAGRHRRLSTKHNLFHQSKLGGEVELHNTHIIPFKAPRDLKKIIMLSAQLSLGSELVYWYWVYALQSFVDWLVASNWQRTTFLHKHWIYSFKIFHPITCEAFETFHRWTHNLFVFSKRSNRFSISAKVICFTVVQKTLSCLCASAW